MTEDRRWLFADQLGPHFLDDADQPALLIESRAVLARRRFHRQKAHLVLSALRHRAAELGDRARFVQAETYAEALDRLDEPLSVCHPTSYAAARFVHRRPRVRVLEARGFAVSHDTFRQWADSKRGKRLLLEDFYRHVRRHLGVLVDDDGTPFGDRWNFDADNREPPPANGALDITGPYVPEEDDIDAEVRRDLDRWEREGEVSFVGRDGPRRFAATRQEALWAADRFFRHRLATFGAYEDAMLAGDDTMSHSTLSAPMNLGLLDPMECVTGAEEALRADRAPLNSVEGYVRQIIGWRDYIWHLYWHHGPNYRHRNALHARGSLPEWFIELDADAPAARCLATVLRQVRDHGWTHHIPRLMVLGNYALQRGWNPEELTDWFHRGFVDGYEWVMVPNVVGMSQHADHGELATKPYAAGGAYIDRMSDFCGPCAYNPGKRRGADACPYTAGYWWFLARNESLLRDNHRMKPPLATMRRLEDLDAVIEQERHRRDDPP